MSGFSVKQPGLLSLLQDRGRFGAHNLGLTTGGPLDSLAFDWANRLLDNDANWLRQGRSRALAERRAWAAEFPDTFLGERLQLPNALGGNISTICFGQLASENIFGPYG